MTQVDWISVEDELPPKYKNILVARPSKHGPIVEQGQLQTDWWKVYGTRTKAVKYWAYLPEVPKEMLK